MTNEYILRAIKRAVPDMHLIVVEETDVIYFFQSSPEPFTWTEFVPGSITRRACDVAKYLPAGIYDLQTIES